MNDPNDQQIGITADGLVALRASDAARAVGVEDPFAAWFVTDEGRQLYAAATRIDPLYEPGNLARFRRTSEILRSAMDDFEQVILLGAGFDCRAWWLDGLNSGRSLVFEVDQTDKLDQKARVLETQDVAVPDWIRAVPADLRTADLNAELTKHGFDVTRPSLVLAEGLSFFLPTETTAGLLDPAHMPLVSGSRLVFDCWSTERVHTLNERALERMGIALFSPFPWPTEAPALGERLRALGYRQVAITPLPDLAERYTGYKPADHACGSWLLVEAEL